MKHSRSRGRGSPRKAVSRPRLRGRGRVPRGRALNRPYKVVGVRYRSVKFGKFVSKARFKGKKKGERVYFSKTRNTITSKKKIRKTFLKQSVAELFPKIKKDKRLVDLLKDYREGSDLTRTFLENRYTGLFEYLEGNADDYLEDFLDLDAEAEDEDFEVPTEEPEEVPLYKKKRSATVPQVVRLHKEVLKLRAQLKKLKRKGKKKNATAPHTRHRLVARYKSRARSKRGKTRSRRNR